MAKITKYYKVISNTCSHTTIIKEHDKRIYVAGYGEWEELDEETFITKNYQLMQTTSGSWLEVLDENNQLHMVAQLKPIKKKDVLVELL